MDGIGGIGCAPARNGGTCGALRITPTAHPPGMRPEGELDHGGVPAVTMTVASAPMTHPAACGDGPLHVDLSGSAVIDAGGLRVPVGAGLDAGDGDAGVIRATSISPVAGRPSKPVAGRLSKPTGRESGPGRGRASVMGRVRPGVGGHRRPVVATDTGVVDGGG
ncbi:hypothetical protein ACIBCT_25310 [Streptosporangium sp. NPDC050855]|uniref:hypothetical protein n=1 Tax=Streptosporangium sp. NPDC050855 TaxID=3366194 RepID=UPI0037A52718